MSSSFNRIKKNIIEAMQSTNNQGTSAYDSVAEVRRVEGDTAWVHIAGGVDETPVKLTVAAKAGDTVQVRVGGGRAWITGNATAPPTDDTAANKAETTAATAQRSADDAQATADDAQATADDAQADIDSQKEYFWHDANGAHVLGSKTAATRYRTDIDSEGMHIKDVSEEVQEVAKFTAEGAQIGKDGNRQAIVDEDGLHVSDGGKSYFHAGYSSDAIDREGKATTAPFYTEGRRKSGSGIGSYSHAEGLGVTASGYVSHAEGESTTASSYSSHAEGRDTTASGYSSHAEGRDTTASGYLSHAEGRRTTASGDYSHAQNNNTIAAYGAQTAIGQYNDNQTDSLFEIGNGTDKVRSNAFRVTKNGKVYDGERCLSDIGTVYRAEKDVAITTTDISTPVKGATITVPAGIYVICGEWIFDTSSTTGARNINLDIYVGENREARSRVYANAQNYASLHASTIVMLDATTELSVRGSSSRQSPAKRTRISAVRVK